MARWVGLEQLLRPGVPAPCRMFPVIVVYRITVHEQLLVSELDDVASQGHNTFQVLSALIQRRNEHNYVSPGHRLLLGFG